MTPALPLSVLVLARDERAHLEALLPALAFAAEVVVVVDAAAPGPLGELAAARGARVFARPLDGFGPQRAFALEQCREPWVLWLDADERLAPGAADRVAAALAAPSADGYTLRRVTRFLGREIRHAGWGGERVLRLFRRVAARFDDAPVHERVHVAGAVAPLDATLEHHSYERWSECVDKLVRYARAGAERAARAGRTASALDVLVRPPLRFVRMYVLQAGFLDGAHGLVLCALAAAQVMLKYGALWALGRERAGRGARR